MSTNNLTMESHNGHCRNSYNLSVDGGDSLISGNEWR